MKDFSRDDVSCESNAPIGVFDSGVGGITVLKELAQLLPSERFIYFADTARMPYGERTPDEIIKFSHEIINWLLDKDVKMIVMACNTSSAISLPKMLSQYNVPIIGTISPAISAVLAKGAKRITVIATSATVATKIFSTKIREVKPDIDICEIACPRFVPLIESGIVSGAEIEDAIRSYLESSNEMDALIYGCTHYPLISGAIEKMIDPDVITINPAFEIAKSVKHCLIDCGIQNQGCEEIFPANARFHCSGNQEAFVTLVNKLFSFMPSLLGYKST